MLHGKWKEGRRIGLRGKGEDSNEGGNELKIKRSNKVKQRLGRCRGGSRSPDTPFPIPLTFASLSRAVTFPMTLNCPSGQVWGWGIRSLGSDFYYMELNKPFKSHGPQGRQRLESKASARGGAGRRSWTEI